MSPIRIEADEVALSIDRAVPLGLILNEAATNSVKHAFAGKSGRIAVRLQAGVGFGEGRLVVTDDGNGFEKHESSGSGLKLIESLARQIGGQVQIEELEEGNDDVDHFPDHRLNQRHRAPFQPIAFLCGTNRLPPVVLLSGRPLVSGAFRTAGLGVVRWKRHRCLS